MLPQACRSFKDENDCVSYCPKDVIYNKNLMINQKNPDVKYTFGSLCLKKCPGKLLTFRSLYMIIPIKGKPLA